MHLLEGCVRNGTDGEGRCECDALLHADKHVGRCAHQFRTAAGGDVVAGFHRVGERTFSLSVGNDVDFGLPVGLCSVVETGHTAGTHRSRHHTTEVGDGRALLQIDSGS